MQPACGDITQPGLGLDDGDAEWLRARGTHVVHAAAAIDFNADREHVHPINVEGTRHVLALAGQMRRLSALAHVSTLYVAGRRTGLIREHELEHDAGFVNPYEESKYDAEQLVRAAARAGLPVSTYRLSLLMGRASDGYVHHTLEAHKMFELFVTGKARRVPGDPSHTLDMLPTDYAVRSVVRTVHRAIHAGRDVPLSAGAGAPTGADLVEACRRHLRRPDWSVDWLSAAEWEAVRRVDDVEGISPAAQWMFEVVGDYLLLPKCFSRQGTDATLGTAAPALPPVLDYLPAILDTCATGNWGRA